jgi:hypothetical protein
MVDTSASNRENCVASLVRSLVNLKSLPAEREHLGHKRHAIELPFVVQSTQDFFLAADFHPIAYSQFAAS